MYNTPILYIVFNALDTVKQTFPKIKAQKPSRLFIASDGSRKERVDEDKKVLAVREWIESQIDWDCDVHKFYREENAGCGVNVSQGITWFFKNVEQGIVLEDDCLPADSFFMYCETLLEYYKDNKKVMHIAGDNPLLECKKYPYSYYFANIQHCWGWASWADRWAKYEFVLTDVERTLNNNEYFKNKLVKDYWSNIFNKFLSYPFEINTWDYQWSYCILKNNGVCINPSKNLIQNIGFTGERTHFNGNGQELSRRTFEIENIVHPKKIKINKKFVRKINKKSFNIVRKREQNIFLRILKKILKLLGLFEFAKNIKNKIIARNGQ